MTDHQARKRAPNWRDLNNLDVQIRGLWELGRPSKAAKMDLTPRPGSAQATLLMDLYWHGETYGSELFRRCKMNQGNGHIRIWRLQSFGLVYFMENVDPDFKSGRRHGGGKPPLFWSLTKRGERMAQLLIDEATQKEKVTA